MAINLLEKWDSNFKQRYLHPSYTANKASKDWSFDGVKTIHVKTMQTVVPDESWPAGPRSGGNRFGTVTDIEDTVETHTLRHHTKWTKSIDKSDNAQSAYMFKAGQFMALQNKEQDMPLRDRYTLREWALNAGTTETLSAALSKSNIAEKLLDLETILDQHAVPQENRWVYLKLSLRKFVRMADEWKYNDTISDMILKGYEGEFGTLKLVFVPDNWMPANVEILVAQENSVLQPIQHITARVIEVAQGFDGPVIEYHSLDDAFVKGIYNMGVITVLKTGTAGSANGQAAKPTTTSATGGYTVASTTGATIYYTVDGTDPRYSDTRTVYSTLLSTSGLASGTKIRIIARKESKGSDLYTSEEKELVV